MAEQELDVVSKDRKMNAFNTYNNILNGVFTFEGKIKSEFIMRKIDRSFVRKIIHYALRDSNGSYKKAFRLLGICDGEYAVMLQFIKRNNCYLDYHSYRR